MNVVDIVKRAILEGKLDTELGITDGDVVKRFDIVNQLLALITLPTVSAWEQASKAFSDEEINEVVVKNITPENLQRYLFTPPEMFKNNNSEHPKQPWENYE
jgi:hypothetical protein